MKLVGKKVGKKEVGKKGRAMRAMRAMRARRKTLSNISSTIDRNSTPCQALQYIKYHLV